MDAAQKKQFEAQWCAQLRKAAVAALPLPVSELKAMLDMLDVELPATSCDHTRRLTEAWLRRHGHDVEAVFAWLDTQGGFCDCEIRAIVEEISDDATA